MTTGRNSRSEILELARALQDGALSAVTLVEETLERIAAPAGEGARCFVFVDAENAREAAEEIDAQRRAGRSPSPFAGIPFSVKDLFDVRGQVTTAGSKVLRDGPPASADAPVVARLRRAGFIPVGRTNMTEFAYSGVGLNPHYGTPASIWDRKTRRIPGGSSSGAGVSVAEGVTPLALGTDTGGSCRVPAAYNGTVGFKPTHGALPSEGMWPLAPSFDVAGPFTRTVTDAALTFDLMAGRTPRPPVERPPSSMVLGIPQDLVLDDLDPPVAEAFEKALSALSRAGVQLVEIRNVSMPRIREHGIIAASEAWSVHADLLRRHADAYDPRVRWRLSMGRNISPEQVTAMRCVREEMISAFIASCGTCDAWVMPTTPNLPPPIATLEKDDETYARLNFMALRNTFTANFLDACAISLPTTAAGEPPVGFSLMAPAGRDHGLLTIAAAIEDALSTR